MNNIHRVAIRVSLALGLTWLPGCMTTVAPEFNNLNSAPLPASAVGSGDTNGGLPSEIKPSPVSTPFVGPAGTRNRRAFLDGTNLVAFQSNRETGGGRGYDIFVYDALAATVLALPAVNTAANETNPRLSSNGEWLVYQSDQYGSQDIFLFNLRNQLINTLRTLNTAKFDEREPDVSDEGNLIVYVSNQAGYDELRVFDLLTGNDFNVPVANRGLKCITWPTISGNGVVIAYGASEGPLVFDKEGRRCEDGACGQSDIFVYSLPDAAQLTPPFINTPADEYNPDLSSTGDRILFVSNRRGSQDVYLTDLRSGFTDNLVLANSKAVENGPRFLGPEGNAFVFQSNRTGNFRIYAYSFLTGLLDTLPTANEPEANTQLRDKLPKL